MRFLGISLLFTTALIIGNCTNPTSTKSDDDPSLVLNLQINNAITNASMYHYTITTNNCRYCADQNEKVNRALNFNSGDSSYVLIAPDSNLDFNSQSFTISFWLNAASEQITGAAICSKGLPEKEQFSLDIYNGTYRFWVRDSAAHHYIINSTVAPDNQWHAFKAVYDRSIDSIFLYQDANCIGKHSAPHKLILTQEPLSIGSRKGSAETFSYFFKGSMSDITIYKTVIP